MSKVRMGMVGGGEGAFIGPVHRIAAELDGQIELVCGAFSSEAERSIRSGRTLYGLPESRCYPDYESMLQKENTLPPEQQMHFVCIATPNHTHASIARASLENGFHVMSDKPLSFDVSEAESLVDTAQQSDLLFGLTHNYTGYPMIKEARHLVTSGQIGSIRRVNVEYIQGWLAQSEEATGENKQAEWRTDPKRSGAGGCIGDIGTHGENLVHYVSGLHIESLCADITSFVPTRRLDDDVNVLLRFNNGAKGVLSASQIAVGVENGLTLRIYGELGGIEWQQMEPNSLVVRWPDRPYEVRRAGNVGTSEHSVDATRLPPGHPEGFLESFAILYRNFAQAIRDRQSGLVKPISDYDLPNVGDGLRGMRFIEAVVASSNNESEWVSLAN